MGIQTILQVTSWFLPPLEYQAYCCHGEGFETGLLSGTWVATLQFLLQPWAPVPCLANSAWSFHLQVFLSMLVSHLIPTISHIFHLVWVPYLCDMRLVAMHGLQVPWLLNLTVFQQVHYGWCWLYSWERGYGEASFIKSVPSGFGFTKLTQFLASAADCILSAQLLIFPCYLLQLLIYLTHHIILLLLVPPKQPTWSLIPSTSHWSIVLVLCFVNAEFFVIILSFPSLKKLSNYRWVKGKVTLCTQ